jgi:hypothetical protein
MAKIRVYRDELDGEQFPSLCMRCGADVERMVPVRFAWMPGWAHLFIFGTTRNPVGDFYSFGSMLVRILSRR